MDAKITQGSEIRLYRDDNDSITLTVESIESRTGVTAKGTHYARELDLLDIATGDHYKMIITG